MKTITIALSGLLLITFTSSCVSSKKFSSKETQLADLQLNYDQVNSDLSACGNSKANLVRQKQMLENDNANLKKQVDYLKDANEQAVKQLKDASVISTSQAESIKKSMDNISAKDAYIQTLQQQMQHKDSLNLALVMNLKGAIGNLNDGDINIKVDKAVVYIDISDNLLFKKGQYEVNSEAREVLGKVATVLRNQKDMDFMVEGHTDPGSYHNGVLVDNWDLSVKRATSIVRILQNDYGLDPARISAAGRSEYKPVADNSTEEGRSANRRTRIIILPQLDQFFKLLEFKQQTN
jgi:chemotaxis protein MotB